MTTRPTSTTLAAWLVVAVAGGAGPARVEVLDTPDGGIQPQAAVDGQGVVHLLAFRGDPAGGDLDLARLDPGEARFSRPIRVNGQAGSAIAIGTIRGGQLALGRDGRVHVAWNGSDRAMPRNAQGTNPMLYARSGKDGAAFEPQRNLMTRTSGLDGGGTVAAGGAGNVYVAWHGRAKGTRPGEAGRRVWVARSTDDGATFSPEQPAFDKPTGACACCGTRALADRDGTLRILYRTATESVGRDIFLLTSRDHADHFDGASVHPWRINACPMSSMGMSDTPSGALLAWETAGQVYFARVDRASGTLADPISPPGTADRKHPAVAGNDRGETLLAWAEGTGWKKGGALAWQVFDRSGKPTAEKGRLEKGIPAWGLPAAVARADGSFLILH